MSRANDLREAEAAVTEERRYTCKMCSTLVENADSMCPPCAQYAEDIENGLFETDEDPDLFSDDDDEAWDEMACGLSRDGQCSQAGSEWCDFECPYRDSELFAGSAANLAARKRNGAA